MYLKVEISYKYLSFNKFVNYTQMTNALLYDAFIQCLCLPLEVFKKICKCLGGILFFVFFLIICAMVLYFIVQCYVNFVGFYFDCALV